MLVWCGTTSAQPGEHRGTSDGRSYRSGCRSQAGANSAAKRPVNSSSRTQLLERGYCQVLWMRVNRERRHPLRSARDELTLDFAGLADRVSPAGTYRGSSAERNVTRTVAQQAALCTPFEELGRFCAVPAAELSRGYGHVPK